MTRVQELFNEGRRYCWYINPTVSDPEKGYRPCLVFENESGCYPNGGGTVEPWYWGKDLKAAERVADRMNEQIGISKEDAFKIVASSMNAQRVEEVGR